MKILTDSIAHYIPISSNDEKWGIVCTTIGYQDMYNVLKTAHRYTHKLV